MIEDFLKDIEQLPLKWSNFSNFNKLNELDKYKTEINSLNKLLGEKEDVINEKLIEIVKNNSKTIDILILLIAIRPLKLKNINIYSPYHNGNKYSKLYNNNNCFDELIYFFENSGLKTLFINKFVSDLSDYLKGIEIGLDSNSRKNRNGKLMEFECEKLISNWCNKNDFTYYKQESLKKLKKDTLINKKFDFIIEINDKYIVIEVNNFNSNGSKVKSISEEYIRLNEDLENENVTFVWITNGSGWFQNKNQLCENLSKINHLINFKMLENDYLNTFL